MKDTIQIPYKKKKIKSRVILFSVLIFLFVALLVLSSVVYATIPNEKFKLADGYVASVTQEKKPENTFLITFDDGSTFTIESAIGQHFNLDELQAIVGHRVFLTLSEYAENKYDVIAIEGEITLLTKEQGIKYLQSNILPLVVISTCLLAVFIVCLAIMLYKHKKQKTKEVNIFKARTTFMGLMPTPAQKKFSLIMLAPLALLIISTILVIVFGEIDDSSLAFWISFGFMTASFVFICVMPFWMYSYLRKSNIPLFLKNLEFDESYTPRPIEEYIYDSFNDLYFTFEKDGIKYSPSYFEKVTELQDQELIELYAKEGIEVDLPKLSEENKKLAAEMYEEELTKQPNEIKLSYRALNLYAKAIFRPNGHIQIFVLSDLNDIDAQGLEHNVMFILDNNLMRLLNKFDIRVDGLDFALRNKEILAKIYCKGKMKHISFDESGIAKVEKFMF